VNRLAERARPHVAIGHRTGETPDSAKIRVGVRQLDAYFAARRAVNGASIDFYDRQVTAVIGPSGCGKSTLLRCLNRMHETVPTARVEGEVLLDGRDIYARGVNAIEVRRHVGMVFQRPTPFPTMSIRDNAASGLHALGRGRPGRRETDEIVEQSLRRAALWDEVKDRLRESATHLSGGQQQRLCIARALATRPNVLLLDEPTASLDPLSTQKIEELVYELRDSITVVIVTHNMQQAARASDRTVFLNMAEDGAGYVVEQSDTITIFTNPADQMTEDYVSGRFG